ncbi:MAG: hypothetical protein U9R43_03695 [Thermodesulfobacteriota bacterium]|nr:hypothetical protein [Thermodesulfobacteriota bacterium]
MQFLKYCSIIVEPELSDFLLDLRRSLAHKGFTKILDISTGMHPKGISCGAPAVLQSLMHQDLSTYLRKKSLNLG